MSLSISSGSPWIWQLAKILIYLPLHSQIELSQGKVTLDDAHIQLKIYSSSDFTCYFQTVLFSIIISVPEMHSTNLSRTNSHFSLFGKLSPFLLCRVIKGRDCLSGYTIEGTEENMQLKFGGAGDPREGQSNSSSHS
jgi:hypothetical protein